MKIIAIAGLMLVIGCSPERMAHGDVGFSRIDVNPPSTDAKGGLRRPKSQSSKSKDDGSSGGDQNSKVPSSLVGIWWGVENDSDDRNVNEADQLNWLIERKNDGTFRNRAVFVDHVRKVYWVYKDRTGTWFVRSGNLKYLNAGSDTEVSIDFKMDGGDVVWEVVTKGEFETSRLRYREKKLGEFSFPFEHYREVDHKEFAGGAPSQGNESKGE